MTRKKQPKQALDIVLISVHGLIRGHNLELGRDSDTGGQVKYVVELARALGEQANVARVRLLTRRLADPQVNEDYAKIVEPLNEKASIIRINCVDGQYIRKEMLWDSLDNFADNALVWLKEDGPLPDIIHSHYADAGYVGSRLSHQLGIPLVHTGHSLGRGKRKQLLATGVPRAEIEEVYKISRRIEAEEMTLAAAERVITSTRQEVEQQYGLYDYYQPECMQVVPPGTDLQQFFPPDGGERKTPMHAELKRFLAQPNKPIILALARPDPKKNLASLVAAYGTSPALQATANLVIVAGNRDDIQEMEKVSQDTLTEILLEIDKYDLYGKVAYPKHHQPEEVSQLFRLAALSRGVFVNPALTEPFGLTLIEAAACGLPIVATEDGGPIDIIANCQNGFLVNPLDVPALAQRIEAVLTDSALWRKFSRNGIKGVRSHYSWQAHVSRYLEVIHPLVESANRVARPALPRRGEVFRKRAVFAELDISLSGDPHALAAFLGRIHAHRKSTIFGIVTGRRLDDALGTLKRLSIPLPDVLVSGQGTAIHFAPDLVQDAVWQRHINHQWNPQEIREILSGQPGLKVQPKINQGAYKISYFIDPEIADVQAIRQLMLRNEQNVNVVFSYGQYLDILPARASKGFALRWCADQLGFKLENTLVCGVTGADADMLRGNTMGVILDNRHLTELAGLENAEKIYFAQHTSAAGILEAIAHYRFFSGTQPE